MPPIKGPEWDNVEESTPDGAQVGKVKCRLCNVEESIPDGVQGGKVKCRLCNKVFWGGASRTRAHILKIGGRGVGPCEAEESKLQPAQDVLRKVEQQSQDKGSFEAQKRKLDRATA